MVLSFIVILIVVIAISAWLTSFRYKRIGQFSWMPAIILTVVSGVNALMTYFTSDSSLTIFLLIFVSVSLGGFIGCGIMRIRYTQKEKAA